MTFYSSHASLLSSYPIPDSANFEPSSQAPSSIDVSGSKKVPDSRSHLAASPSDQIRHHDLPTLTASKTSGIQPACHLDDLHATSSPPRPPHPLRMLESRNGRTSHAEERPPDRWPPSSHARKSSHAGTQRDRTEACLSLHRALSHFSPIPRAKRNGLTKTQLDPAFAITSLYQTPSSLLLSSQSAASVKT